MLNSITVEDRTWSCQLSMKKTRNGTKAAITTTSVTPSAPLVSSSSQLVDWRTVTVPFSGFSSGKHVLGGLADALGAHAHLVEHPANASGILGKLRS